MKFFCIFTSAVLIITMLCGFVPSRSDMELYDNVVRLHVIARSDSEHDQKIKLLVRDAVLKEMDSLVSMASSAEEAANIISEHIGEVSEAVLAALTSVGEDSGARVTLFRESYPTKDYGDIALPSGEYLSLKVIIGEGEGQNWWCVLFPSLCLSAVKGAEESIEVGLTPEQYRTITESGEKESAPAPKYRLKFRFLELIEELLSQ